ncbi:MAG: hypothetical protein HQK66_01270 [Desulfamplus sp.]|nr:hypothetical protein [Desulfamplus sp.]
MSNISSFNSLNPGYGRGDTGHLHARASENKEALNASEKKSLELSLTTREGDVVTINAGSFMDFASLSYDRSGKVSNGYSTASAKTSSHEMTLASGSQFTFSVQGSLSEDEMKDIESIVKTLDEVVYAMSTGKMDDAVEKALGMGLDNYGTVSGFNADLSYSSSYSYEKETATQTYYSGSPGIGQDVAGGIMGRDYSGIMGRDSGGMPRGSGTMGRDYGVMDKGSGLDMSDIFKNSSSRLLEMMLEELEKMKEEGGNIPRRAAEPVDQLMVHHMDEHKGEVPSALSLDDLKDTREGMRQYFLDMASDMSSFSKFNSALSV